MLILIMARVDVVCCPTAIMDMSVVAMGTAGLPSGSTPPPCPEAAARVRTTSTAQGKDFMCNGVLDVVSWMLKQNCSADTDHRFNMIRIAALNEMLCREKQPFPIRF